MNIESTKLRVLIIDNDAIISKLLTKILELFPIVEFSNSCGFQTCKSELDAEDYNTIIIDPFGVDLDKSEKIIFKIRKTNPKIVFILFTDFNNIKNTEFYAGERKRFEHYHKINKRTPFYLFEELLTGVLMRSQRYLYRGGIYMKNKNISFEAFNDLQIEINQLVGKDRVSEALEKVNEYYIKVDNKIKKEITILSLMLNSAEKEKIMNTISFSEFNRIKNQVASGLLEIINEK